jgi:hypothetical protein
VQDSVTLTEMEIADEEFGIDKIAVKHLVKTEHERLVTDEAASVCGVQSLCQTLARATRKDHAESLPLQPTSV